MLKNEQHRRNGYVPESCNFPKLSQKETEIMNTVGVSLSVVSHSLWPHGPSARFLCPCDSPGKILLVRILEWVASSFPQVTVKAQIDIKKNLLIKKSPSKQKSRIRWLHRCILPNIQIRVSTYHSQIIRKNCIRINTSKLNPEASFALMIHWGNDIIKKKKNRDQ